MSYEYTIDNCGRVKMAGGSFKTYYDLAEAIRAVEEPSAEAIIQTHNNFKNIRKQPPFDLLLAFFPDDSANISYRLRGAGAYRHLRMDQGPGGNFTRFDLGEENMLRYNLQKEKGFAMPEELISNQLQTEAYPELLSLKEAIQKSFEKNDYNKTAILVNKFTTLAKSLGLDMHNGEHVGSKSGFFFIRPTATDRPTHFPIEKIPHLKAKIDEALNKSLSLAEYTREYLRSGKNFLEATTLARQKYAEKGGKDYQDNGLLYFQPDCFVDNRGNVEVEKINMPDVGMFMTMLNRPSNGALQNVVNANLDLKDRLKQTCADFLTKDEIVLITRDDVLDYKADTLELLEIKALKDMLHSIGKQVSVKSLSDYESLNKSQEILLLNVNADNKDYGKFAEHIVKQELTCYADPLVYYFKDEATTLKTMEIPHEHMEHFLQLIKPKDINAKNAENIYNRLQYIMKHYDMNEDILYANISGYKMPVPVFKYSLHSFGQIYKAYEKMNNPAGKIKLSSVPVNSDNAIFYGKDAPRLAAYRFMCRKER